MRKSVAHGASLENWGRFIPHKLRHPYASALVGAGRALAVVREHLGHSSIATTQV